MRPSSWNWRATRVDRGALDAEQPGECLLGQRQTVAADTILRGQQPARCSRFDRVKGVACDRLHDLREEIVGVAAEQVLDEGRASLELLQRVERDDDRGAGDLDLGVGIGGGVAAADDPADRALLTDRTDFDRPSAVEFDDHRNHQRIIGEQAVGDRLAGVEHRIAAGQFDQRRQRLDQRANLVVEGRQQAIAGKSRREASVAGNDHMIHLTPITARHDWADVAPERRTPTPARQLRQRSDP